MTELQTFREAIQDLAPAWLQRHWGSRLLYSIGVQLDCLTDAVAAAIRHRLPNVVDAESLPRLGRDRGMVRGVGETAPHFAERLATWLDEHRLKGSPWPLLRMIHGAIRDEHPYADVDIIDQHSRYYRITADGTESFGDWAQPDPWDWGDGVPSSVRRYWVIVYGATNVDAVPGTPGTWKSEGDWDDAGTIGDGGVIGFDHTVNASALPDVHVLRSTVAAWTAAHALNVNLIIVMDLAAWGADVPDGTRNWARWRNRNKSALYLDGV